MPTHQFVAAALIKVCHLGRFYAKNKLTIPASLFRKGCHIIACAETSDAHTWKCLARADSLSLLQGSKLQLLQDRYKNTKQLVNKVTLQCVCARLLISFSQMAQGFK